MKLPWSKEDWEHITEQTIERWQFPNCFVAVNGKHVGIICLKDSESEFYNYKGFYSIVLLIFVYYDYGFPMAEVGFQECISDGGVYSFYSALKKQQLSLSEPCALSQSSHPFWKSTQYKGDISIVFVAGDAFTLSTNCRKAFGFKNASDMERMPNYLLSRFRRIAENGFVIWSNRFKLFSTQKNN